MRAKVTNVSAWQSVPLSGTLDISIPQRYVDSSGNATVRHYSGVLRLDGVAGPRWVNALNPNEDLWTVVQGPTDPVGPLATFNEILSYGPQSDVRTTFSRRLVSSDLSGLFFDYAQPAPVNPAGFGVEPLSMQAARQLLDEAPGIFGEMGEVLADIRGAVADTEQSQTQVLASANRIAYYGGDHLTLPAGAGDYLIMRGSETGQVWTRATDGATATRSTLLESVSAVALQAATSPLDTRITANTAQTTALSTQLTGAFGSLTKIGLGLLSRNGRETATADGNTWVWLSAANATAQGKTANGGTVLNAAGGGVWVRLYSGAILPKWFDVPTDGTDATLKLDTLFAALKTDDKVDFGSATYSIITAREFGITLPRIDLIGNGAVFEVAAAARLNFWNALFRPSADDIRMLGRITINCNVPDSAVETDPVTGANGYIQRGVFVSGAKRVLLSKVFVTKPLSEGIRGFDGSSGTLTECDVTHRSGYLDVGRTQIASSRTCISITSTGYQGADATGGTNGFIPWMNRDRALPQTTKNWMIDRCKVRGGTHGFAVFNAAYVTFRDCEADDNSHRNVVASPTADYIQVLGGQFTKAGSTNVHFANGCTNFVVQGVTTDTVLLTGLEGDGIKAYVGCTDGIFANNIVKNALWHGIRVAYGCQRITIANNQVALAPGRQVAGTAGIGVFSRSFMQADQYALVTPDPGVNDPLRNAFLAMQSRTLDIVVSGNAVSGAEAGYVVAHEKASTLPNAQPTNGLTCNVQNVSLIGNSATNCTYGFSAADLHYGGGASSSGFINDLVLSDLSLRSVTNTAYTVGTPPQLYFRTIRGVAHVGTGFLNSGVKVLSKEASVVAYSGAGAPGGSGVYANGHTYLNESNGELYRFQSGAWVKVTAA